MGQSDWTECDDSLDTSNVGRAVTSLSPPPGSRFSFGMKAKSTTPGAVALRFNGAGYDPAPLGGSVAGLLRRGVSEVTNPAAQTFRGFSPFLFLGLQGTSVFGGAYLLGLCDEDADGKHSIVLCKAPALLGGIPAVPHFRPPVALPGLPPPPPDDSIPPMLAASGVLQRSRVFYDSPTWVQVKLSAKVQPSGDVVLQAFASDLSKHAATNPRWEPIDGMPAFTDLVTSSPFVGGRSGFGFNVGGSDGFKVGFFDGIEITSQLQV